MLEALDLECTRGERVLFSGLGLRVAPGTLLRVAGPNGTGKTSLLRMLCGLLQPTQGEIRWRGKAIRALKEEYWSALAYVGHLNGVKDDLTAVENLRASAGIAGLEADEGAPRGALDSGGTGPPPRWQRASRSRAAQTSGGQTSWTSAKAGMERRASSRHERRGVIASTITATPCSTL